MKKLIGIAMMVVLILAAYLTLWPVPVEPVVWQAPTPPGYVGEHAANSKLAGAQLISLNGEAGPEHIAPGPDGQLYTGVQSGHILRLQADGGGQQVIADTGGRPLGIAFDSKGNMIVADGVKGLLQIGGDGKITVLNDSYPFLNAVAIASNGKVYFTSSSQRFAPAQWGGTLQAATLDVIEQSATGRVLEYDPATKATRIVAEALSLPNGLAFSSDERQLLVSESGRYRVWKLDLASGERQVLLDNLPGYPDNLTRGLNGKLWLGLAGPRNDLDKMAGKPFLRRLMLRVPRALWPDPKPYGHVLAFGEDGKVLADLQDPSGKSPVTTGATETVHGLYIHNVDGKNLGWLKPQ